MIKQPSIVPDEEVRPTTAARIKKEFDKQETAYEETEKRTGMPFCRKCMHMDWEMQYVQDSIKYAPNPYEGRTPGVKPIQEYQKMKLDKVFNITETHFGGRRTVQRYAMFKCPFGHSVSFEECPENAEIFKQIDAEKKAVEKKK